MKDITVTRTEQYFVSDITYVKSKERTCCLSLLTGVLVEKKRCHFNDM